MGTRGAYGFIVEGQTKVTYNHSDSYPDWLGRRALDACRKLTAEQMTAAAKAVEMVSQEGRPTNEQIEKCRHLSATTVGSQTLDDWYCLLRKAQGESDFLLDSLFCEWAYIINLDDGVLEIYEGFNKDREAAGRYASKHRDCPGEYWGVALRKIIPLSELHGMPDDKATALIDELEGRTGEE